MMNAQEIIHYIATAEKKTPVKITLREKSGEAPISFGSAKVFGVGQSDFRRLEGTRSDS